MSLGVKEVIQISQNLERSAQEISSGINEMVTGTDQINLATNHVNDVSIKNRESIIQLSNEVSRFKVE